MERLNISNNRITDIGAQAIAEFVARSKVLDTLQMHWNKIRGRGSICLAKALKINNTLKVLDCSFNSFGSEGNRKVQVKDSNDQDKIETQYRHLL